jgi:hypothetical protein
MDKIKNLGISAIVAALVTVFIASYVITPDTIVNNVPGKPLGGTNPDVISPYLRFGDVSVWAARTTSFATASTTVCSIQSPAATSTLRGAAVDISVSTSSSYILTIARATTPSASTTPLISSASIASGAKTTLYASSTGQGSDVWAPNTWLNVTVRGGSSGVTYPFTMGAGSCQATWEQVSY